MSLRPWLSGFRARLNNSRGRRIARRRDVPSQQITEQLEQRTLLTATALVIGTDLTVLTDAAGEVRIAVPGDRAGTFEAVIVRKRQRRLSDVDAVAISLFAKGLTTGEISAHFAEVYGASIGKDTVSRITDKVLEEMGRMDLLLRIKLRMLQIGLVLTKFLNG